MSPGAALWWLKQQASDGLGRELAGCDLLTISPQLLGELKASTEPLGRKLDPVAARGAARNDKITSVACRPEENYL